MKKQPMIYKGSASRRLQAALERRKDFASEHDIDAPITREQVLLKEIDRLQGTLRLMAEARGGLPRLAREATVDAQAFVDALAVGSNPPLRTFVSLAESLGLRVSLSQSTELHQAPLTAVGFAWVRQNLAEMVQRAAKGEKFLLTRDGLPVAKLTGMDRVARPLDAIDQLEELLDR